MDAVIIGCTANVPKHSAALLSSGADLVWSKPLPKEDVIFASIETMMKMRRPQISSEQMFRVKQPVSSNVSTRRTSFNQTNRKLSPLISLTEEHQKHLNK